MTENNEHQPLTTCIKHLAVSALSSGTARIKSSCNLIGNRFELPNVSYTQPLYTSVERQCNSEKFAAKRQKRKTI